MKLKITMMSAKLMTLITKMIHNLNLMILQNEKLLDPTILANVKLLVSRVGKTS